MGPINQSGIKLIHGDAIEEMKNISDGSIDFILTDPPYGITACKWDAVIPFEPMWQQIHRIIKPNGAIAVFGSEPFSSALRMSNIKNYKYDWIWRKERGTGFQIAKYRPMLENELISIFCLKSPIYYPIMIPLERPRIEKFASTRSDSSPLAHINKGERIVTELYPKNILEFSRDRPRVHPTQKPVPILEYLIKTYTLEGETVLDFTMGSGSTGVAAKNLNRRFIGIEKDEKYFGIANKRIFDEYESQPSILT